MSTVSAKHDSEWCDVWHGRNQLARSEDTMPSETYLQLVPNETERQEDTLEPGLPRVFEPGSIDDEPDFEIYKSLPPELMEIAAEYDVRHMTPRQMVNLSFDLYSAGFLSQEQYTELAFQSELMPNFESTIGALTGEKAQPDLPRDYIAIWRQRVSFERTHCTEDERVVQRAQSTLDLLKSIRKPRAPEHPHRKLYPKLERIQNIPTLSLRGVK